MHGQLNFKKSVWFGFSWLMRGASV